MFYSSNLKKFKEIKHCFFSRKKGYSKGIYSSLNCGFGSYDNKKNINKNLKKISKIFKIKPKKIKLMYQTHSSKVIYINKKNIMKMKYLSDAILTNEKGYAVGVLTADCVPILLYDKENKTVGCIHAGWKGAYKDIISKTINKFKKIGSKKINILAAVGPCIGKSSYEVGDDFKKKFLKKSKKNKKFFRRKNHFKFLFDLRKFVNLKLKECGVKNINNLNYDTYRKKNTFFSYRRSKIDGDPDYGRCLSLIKLN